MRTQVRQSMRGKVGDQSDTLHIERAWPFGTECAFGRVQPEFGASCLSGPQGSEKGGLGR